MGKRKQFSLCVNDCSLATGNWTVSLQGHCILFKERILASITEFTQGQ